MAKHAQTKNKTFSPQEELRVKEQELQMEQRRQLQVKQTMECDRLETVLTEQKVKKLMYYPFAVGCLTVIVLILYAIVKTLSGRLAVIYSSVCPCFGISLSSAAGEPKTLCQD